MRRLSSGGLLLLGGGGGRGSLPSRQNAEPPRPSSVYVRWLGGRSLSETEVEKGRGNGQSGEGIVAARACSPCNSSLP